MDDKNIDILKVKRLNPLAQMPQRGTQGAAGLDLFACIDSPITIKPHDLVIIPTGIAIALPNENYVAYIYARSGLGVKNGICLSNGVGVVDSDYRGEICVGLCNISKKSYTIMPQERIAQLVIAPVCPVSPTEVEILDDTERGNGGFGSTGK